MARSSWPTRGILTLVLSSAALIILQWKPASTRSEQSPSDTQLTQVPTAQVPLSKKRTLPAHQQKADASNSTENAVSQILSNAVSRGERRTDLYHLTQEHTKASTAALIEIASSRVETKDVDSRFDVALRITALEALDQRLVSGEADASAIQRVLRLQSNPTLRFFAQISLDGLASGRPGKLTRFIDKTFSVVGDS